MTVAAEGNGWREAYAGLAEHARRQLLPDLALIMNPGESLVITVPPEWSPQQCRELNDALNAWVADPATGGPRFRVMVTPASGVAVVREGDRLIDAAAARTMLDVSDNTLRSLVRRGYLERVDMLGAPRYRLSQVEALTRSGTGPQRPPAGGLSPLLRFTYLGFQLCGLADDGGELSAGDVRDRALDGSLLAWLRETSGGSMDLSLLGEEDQEALRAFFADAACMSHRTYGVRRNGIALLLAWCLDGAQVTGERH